ncbi:MAG: ATP-binding protein [Chloroflexi bacterium]|nr:ATP-binding protein [Chloroflexota bacterium]
MEVEFSISKQTGKISYMVSPGRWESCSESLEELGQNVRDNWLEKDSGIPLKFQDVCFDNFEGQRDPAAFEAVKNCADWIVHRYDGTYDERNAKPSSLVLYSPGRYGCGKSHLAVAAVQSYMAAQEPIFVKEDGHVRLNKCPVRFTTLSGLLGRIRKTFKEGSGETEEAIIQEMVDIEVLCLDDMDKYQPADKRFLQRVLFEIINGRYENDMASTILTSNLSLAKLREFIGGACASRLTEMAQFVECTGEDYRLVARSRRGKVVTNTAGSPE